MAFWGRNVGDGYQFSDFGSEAFGGYVHEFFTRVYQRPWPPTAILPFQFMRGLLAEANRQRVNWARFAFIRTHSKSGAREFKCLPEFAGLHIPVPFSFPKVAPPDQSPTVPAVTVACSTVASVSRCDDSDLKKTNLEVAELERRRVKAKGITSLSAPLSEKSFATNLTLLLGLAQLRKPILEALETARKGVEAEREESTRLITEKSEYLLVETAKLRFMSRKQDEKSDTYDKASKWYKRAYELEQVARQVPTSPLAPEQIDSKKKFVQTCEELTRCQLGNLQTAHQKLNAYTFKVRRVTENLTKQSTKLNELQSKHFRTCTVVENKLTELNAVKSLFYTM